MRMFVSSMNHNRATKHCKYIVASTCVQLLKAKPIHSSQSHEKRFQHMQWENGSLNIEIQCFLWIERKREREKESEEQRKNSESNKSVCPPEMNERIECGLK